MPKIEPYFDAVALLEEVQAVDLGLWITTNNPAGFRRTLYVQMRKTPHLKCSIYTDPESPTRLALLKKQLELPERDHTADIISELGLDPQATESGDGQEG